MQPHRRKERKGRRRESHCCHPDRSEGSGVRGEVRPGAQDDNQIVFLLRPLRSLRLCGCIEPTHPSDHPLNTAAGSSLITGHRLTAAATSVTITTAIPPTTG